MKPVRILVIRRDNIGDLVCTTPLFAALRQAMPESRICALVNSYNRAVLEGHPDVDEVFAYTKGKHREAGESLLDTYWHRLALMRRLRAQRFDWVLLAGQSQTPRLMGLARWLKAGRIVGYGDPHASRGQRILVPSPLSGHEVERTLELLSPLGIRPASLPPLRIRADIHAAGKLRSRLGGNGPVIGLHISARKPSQRWPLERFAELARLLHESYGARLLLFWAPGAAGDARHPGDDDQARILLERCANLPLLACPTHNLRELIDGLSACDQVVCSDGGAMHMAAALGKPILCFFGQSDSTRWHPWGVPYRLLQPESRDVADIGMQEVNNAFSALQDDLRLEKQ